MMKHISVYLLSLCFMPAITPMAFAETGAIPSHCKANEYALLNAKMAGATNQIKTGRTLSICADKANEPLGKLFYRYGAIGKVELEQVATPGRPFYIFTRNPVPRIGENIIFFTNHGYTYYVTEFFAMGTGVSLMVYHKGKRIVNLFSGNEEGVDYESNLMSINFEKSASPILIKKAPLDKL